MSESGGVVVKRLNLDVPRYDQSTYEGRAKHFFIVTNPLNIFCGNKQLEEAKHIVQSYRSGKNLPGLNEDDIWSAKHIYDSAFHPDTEEKMFIIGRMAAQVPMNMTITGCMLTFYKTTPAVVFWQCVNQAFNAVVNYTNRSGDHPITLNQLGKAGALATTAATVTAVALKQLSNKMPPILARYVPFAAVAAANCINIPCMRSREIAHGIPIFTEDGTRVGESPKAAKKAIAQVVLSRILMAVPSMWIPPIIMSRLEKGKFLKKYPFMNGPVQVGIVGFLLVFATPLCCAIFPQKSSMLASHLEPELQDKLKALPTPVERIYYNKGL